MKDQKTKRLKDQQIRQQNDRTGRFGNWDLDRHQTNHKREFEKERVKCGWD